MTVTVKQLGPDQWAVCMSFGMLIVRTEDEAHKAAREIRRIWQTPEPDAENH